MSFVRLLPLMLLVSTLAFADSDKNFKIPLKLFKAGTVVEPIADMAIQGEKGVFVSEQLAFPLKENKIYLRHKKAPKAYQWMSGDLVTKNLKKLHAFSLKDNYLKVEDVAKMRFYGSQNAKAFQDETDLYFDREYIYSPRVPKLFFVKNGKWQIINETSLPGVIKFTSSELKLEVSTMKKTFKKAPKMLFPAKPGFHAYVFSASGCLPYVDAGIVEGGEVLEFKTSFLKLEQENLAKKKQFTISITMDDVKNLQTLESTEALYDRYMAELDKISAAMDKSLFEDHYPVIRTASSFSMSESDKKYADYARRYNEKKMEARQLWRESKIENAADLNRALHEKLDAFQALPLRGSMMPASIEPEFTDVPLDASVDSAKAALAVVQIPVNVAKADSAKTDTTKTDSVKVDSTKADTTKADSTKTDTTKTDSVNAEKKEVPVPVSVTRKEVSKIKMTFGTDHARFDFAWAGTVVGLSMDSLYTWIIRRRPDLKISIELQSNKPVWVHKSETVIWRHHYRYVNMEFQVGKDTYKGIGEFTLPDYLLSEPEVQEWLDSLKNPPRKEKAPKANLDSVEINMPSILDLATSARIIRDPKRGSLAMIDSGSFRYKGHVVSMSPFAIMTTEMTQNLYEKLMQSLDSTKRIPDRSKYKHPNKPVHNITWDDARFVCQELGGDLPSEAQWEFAARADNDEGAIWVKDSVPSPGTYAVYRGNSYNLGSKFPEYGPQPVGSRKPNAWGLHDMSGNVAEWTRDKYFMFSFIIEPSNPTGAAIGSNKVYKGGSWRDGEKLLNVTKSDDEDPRYWSETIGFRCVYPYEAVKE